MGFDCIGRRIMGVLFRIYLPSLVELISEGEFFIILGIVVASTCHILSSGIKMSALFVLVPPLIVRIEFVI
jgi:hypothetical protein